MEQLKDRVDELERGLHRVETVLQGNASSVEKLQQALNILTDLQVAYARDKAQIEHQLERGLDRGAQAHDRLNKLEGHLSKLIMSILTGFLAAVAAVLYRGGK